MWELDRTNNQIELFPGTLDYLSIEWDTAYASYYSSSGDGTISTVKGVNTGIVLFNVEDAHFLNADYAYGSVRLTRIQQGNMIFGSKFVHTYTTTLITGTVNVTYAPSVTVKADGSVSLGLPYTMGFLINVSSGISQWEMWADAWASL